MLSQTSQASSVSEKARWEVDRKLFCNVNPILESACKRSLRSSGYGFRFNGKALGREPFKMAVSSVLLEKLKEVAENNSVANFNPMVTVGELTEIFIKEYPKMFKNPELPLNDTAPVVKGDELSFAVGFGIATSICSRYGRGEIALCFDVGEMDINFKQRVELKRTSSFSEMIKNESVLLSHLNLFSESNLWRFDVSKEGSFLEFNLNMLITEFGEEFVLRDSGYYRKIHPYCHLFTDILWFEN